MMLKYIIKDLKETLAYLPYGIMAGAVVGLLLNGLNARRERKGKDTFPMAGLMAFSLYLMIILVITFFLQRGWQPDRHGSGTVLYLGDECEEPCVCRGKCTAVYSLWIYLSLGIPMASGIFS